MFKLYSIAFISVVVLFLSGCNSNASSATGNNGIITTTGTVKNTAPVVSPKVTPEKKKIAFPVNALAIPPASEMQQRRENGNTGNNKTYFMSIINNEKIGTCFTRRVEVQGTFEKNLSENWSLGQYSKWNTKKTSVTVNVEEDSRMCGGTLTTLNGTAVIANTSFTVDDKTKSIHFYVNIPVYSKDGESTENVNIAIDSTKVATGDFAGGTITSGHSNEWASNYGSKSESKFEGVNITLSGGVYINNLAVNGVTHAKISRSLSRYNTNGTRPIDPFVQQPVSGGGGMG